MPESSAAFISTLTLSAPRENSTQQPRSGHSSTAALWPAMGELDLADALIAVWDGEPARGYGGTADVVDLARTRGLDVTVIWPDGASR